MDGIFEFFKNLIAEYGVLWLIGQGFGIVAIVQAVMCLFTWDGWYSIFILAGICINTYCMSLSDPQKVRKSILVTSPLVLVYDLFARSIGGTVYESVALCSAIIGILRMRKKENAR